MNEVLSQFLEKTCKEHPGMKPVPFVDAAFLYDEYCQFARTRPQPVVDKKEFVKELEAKFSETALLKIGPHPHFVGISYRQWRK